MENIIIGQVSHFNFLGYDVTNNKQRNVDNKQNKFRYMSGRIRNFFKCVRNVTKLKFYNVMAVPVLLYGSENWTLTKSQLKKLKLRK